MTALSFDDKSRKYNAFETFINELEFDNVIEDPTTSEKAITKVEPLSNASLTAEMQEQIRQQVLQIANHLIHDLGVKYWETHLDELQILVRQTACQALTEEFQRSYPNTALQASDWEHILTMTMTLGWLLEVAIINEMRKGRLDSDASND
jgi:hypothetical protein